MLVVDLLHEFELGVWKLTFIHIIRVLYTAVPGGGAVSQLNARCMKIPSCIQISADEFIKILPDFVVRK